MQEFLFEKKNAFENVRKRLSIHFAKASTCLTMHCNVFSGCGKYRGSFKSKHSGLMLHNIIVGTPYVPGCTINHSFWPLGDYCYNHPWVRPSYIYNGSPISIRERIYVELAPRVLFWLKKTIFLGKGICIVKMQWFVIFKFQVLFWQDGIFVLSCSQDADPCGQLSSFLSVIKHPSLVLTATV